MESKERNHFFDKLENEDFIYLLPRSERFDYYAQEKFYLYKTILRCRLYTSRLTAFFIWKKFMEMYFPIDSIHMNSMEKKSDMIHLIEWDKKIKFTEYTDKLSEFFRSRSGMKIKYESN